MATKAPNKAEAMKASRPSDFAKIIGVDPKRLRARLRNLGIRVSDGDEFTTQAKNELWAIFVEGKQTRKTKATKSGGNAKQRRTKARKEKTEPVPAE